MLTSRIVTSVVSRVLAGRTPVTAAQQLGAAVTLLPRLLSSQAQAAAQTPLGASTQGASTSGRPPPAGGKPDLVQQFLGIHNLNNKQRLSHERKEIMRSVQRHTADTGSPAVMCAVWTHRLRDKTKTFYTRHKNFHGLLHFQIMMNRRRRMLGYLRQTDFRAYARVIANTGLADVFGAFTRADRYPVGQAYEEVKSSDNILRKGSQDFIRRCLFAYQKRFRLKKTGQWKRILPELRHQDPCLPPPPVTQLKGSVQKRPPKPKAPFAEDRIKDAGTRS